METQQFVAEFGYIANAPEGLTSLRQMIYQLAVTGSLTERAKSDEDAGMLLARIGKERQRLIRAKQYKRMLELESEPVRLPQGIVLPATWRWTRLLDIGEINPRNDAPDEQLAAFVPMSGVPQLHRSIIVAETERWGDIRKDTPISPTAMWCWLRSRRALKTGRLPLWKACLEKQASVQVPPSSMCFVPFTLVSYLRTSICFCVRRSSL